MLLIYLNAALLAIALLVFYATANNYKYDFLPLVSGFMSIILGVAIVGQAAGVPLQRTHIYASIQAHEELRKMDNMQAKLSDYELVQWRQTIAHSNTELARAKYYASNPWTSAYFPSAVLDVEPIR